MKTLFYVLLIFDFFQRLHIAHGVFWTNSNGEVPPPFTLITHGDVCDGTWTPKDAKHLEWAKFYTKTLEEKGRFTLCIWPEHCLVSI
jgi:nicotinamidase/pyrazinamidase